MDLDNILKFFLVSVQKLVPVRAKKSYHILNFLLQTSINVSDNSIAIVVHNTVELRWLELVGTVSASSTHPCVRAIPRSDNFQVGSCVLYAITDTTFFSTKVAKRT